MANFYDVQAIQTQIQKDNVEKVKALKSRVEKFSDTETLDDAKALLQQYFRADKEFQEFGVAGVRCVIVNREDVVRISYDSPTEYICYDFA